MKSEKLLEMEEYIRFRQTISLKELQEHFNISINTVRRYIAVLLEQNSDFQKVWRYHRKKSSKVFSFSLSKLRRNSSNERKTPALQIRRFSNSGI